MSCDASVTKSYSSTLISLWNFSYPDALSATPSSNVSTSCAFLDYQIWSALSCRYDIDTFGGNVISYAFSCWLRSCHISCNIPYRSASALTYCDCFYSYPSLFCKSLSFLEYKSRFNELIMIIDNANCVSTSIILRYIKMVHSTLSISIFLRNVWNNLRLINSAIKITDIIVNLWKL